ncbi:GNAT family N-acetyltransferase [Liberiplasma polymorphum]|uniref:GNAT family N-acetyltransferase n=1 Tax=Liberiplasma polymorphum TaxID=3374570 RepID=UPI003774B89C
MMNYKDAFIELWNTEFPDYPLFTELLHHAFDSPAVIPGSTKLLWDKETMVGLVIIKQNYNASTGAISMLYVHKDYRHMGYGKRLLNHALEWFKSLNIHTVTLGADYDCLFPGLINQDAIKFFEKQGFKSTGKAFNLITDLKPEVKSDQFPYTFKRCEASEVEALKAFVKSNFSYRWFKELDGINHERMPIFIAKDKEKIIAFARGNHALKDPLMHNTNYQLRYPTLGGVGPLGVDKNYRNQGLGKAITLFACNKLFEEGASHVLIDWTGLTKFYEKLGFKMVDTFYTMQIDFNS